MFSSKIVAKILSALVKFIHAILFLATVGFLFGNLLDVIYKFTHLRMLTITLDRAFTVACFAGIIYLLFSKKTKKLARRFYIIMTFITPLILSGYIATTVDSDNEIKFVLLVGFYIIFLVFCICFGGINLHFLERNEPIRVVGSFSASVVHVLNLSSTVIECPIYITESNIAHMKEKHPEDYKKYGMEIENIIKNANYVGRNKEDGSIEFTKEYPANGDFVKVAVRPTSHNTYIVRTMYTVEKGRTKILEEAGDLVKIR